MERAPITPVPGNRTAPRGSGGPGGGLRSLVRDTRLEPLARRVHDRVGRKGRRLRREARLDAQSRSMVRSPARPGPNADGSVAAFLSGTDAGRRLATKRGLVHGLCQDRDVLDIGCVQHSWQMSLRNPRWLHREIAEVAKRCTGVDYLDDDVERLREEGFHMVAGDVLRDDPPGRFDVVVAGDIIEHVENPAALLAYIGNALRPDGCAIVTTPNAFYIGHLWIVLGRRRPNLNPEHVAIFDPSTLCRLIERSPLEVTQLYWLASDWPPFWNSSRWVARRVVGPVLHGIDRLLIRRRPYLHNDFAAVLRLKGPGQVASAAAERGRSAMAFHGITVQ